MISMVAHAPPPLFDRRTSLLTKRESSKPRTDPTGNDLPLNMPVQLKGHACIEAEKSMNHSTQTLIINRRLTSKLREASNLTLNFTIRSY